jgi:peptide/nickel transport system ATP-binding protein
MQCIGRGGNNMETSLMEIKDCSVTFENKKSFLTKAKLIKAVNKVNLKIKPGEIIAVVGESGCGKTTIGKMITRVLKPTSGHLKFMDKDIWNLKKNEFDEYRRSVQLVHQDSFAALNPARTVKQSLTVPLIKHKIVKNKKVAVEKIIEILEMVGLTPAGDFLDKYPHQLSGGQRQRVLLARALSVKPKLIVADEPVSMVDVSIRISLLDLMSDMNKKFNISFMYITHDLSTARYIANNGRIVVMYLGKMVEVGNLEDVIKNPSHPYLHALLSAVPVPDPNISRKLKTVQLKSIELPDPSQLPSGCVFHPRCPYAENICRDEEPELKSWKGEMVACHIVEKIPQWRIAE